MPDIAIPDNGDYAVGVSDDGDLDSLFDSPIASGASAVFDEGTLEKEKLSLCGVPFVIREIGYHLPEPTKDQPNGRNYVTLHVNVAGPRTLASAQARGWFDPAKMLYGPGEALKVNDGGTGICRQITRLLDAQGLIQVGPVTDNSDYDRVWTQWNEFGESTQENAKNGDKVDVPHFTVDRRGTGLVIVVRHGLRVSQAPDYPDTNIFYLN
jgi:hypothetical protein